MAGKLLNDGTITNLPVSSIDGTNDRFLVHDASAAAAVQVTASDVLKRWLSSSDLSWMSAFANLAAVDSANDKFIVWDNDANAFKTLTATQILDRLLTTLDISALSAITTVEGIDPAADQFLVWDATATAQFKTLPASQLVNKLWQGPKVAITTTPIGSPTISSSTSGSLYHNTGATLAITVNLPAATAGLRYSFVRNAAYNITLDGNGSETINGATTYVLRSSGRVDVECFTNGAWVVTSTTGVASGVIDVRSYGATGDGTTDDTAAIAAAITASSTTNPVWIPAGTYKVTSTLTLGTGQVLFGEGQHSVLAASSVTGAVVSLGTHGGSSVYNLGVRDLKITGTATRAVDIQEASNFFVRNITIGGAYHAATLTDGLRTKNSHGGEIENVVTNGSTITNAHFLFGAAFNAVRVHNIYTGGGDSGGDYAVLIDSTNDSGSLSSAASQLSMVTCQSTKYGIYFRNCSGMSVDGLYVEEVAQPIVFGDAANSKFATSCSVRGASIYTISGSHPDYSSRKAIVDFNNAYGCVVDGIDCEASSGIDNIAPITITPTSGGSGAKAFARVTAAGAVHSVEVVQPGSGYNADPTISAGGAGAGATFTVTRSGTTVSTIAVTAGGSGYTPTGLFPVLFTYRIASRCSVSGITWYAATGGGYARFAPAYPWLVRDASSVDWAGVHIRDDLSWRQGQNGQQAELRKAYGGNLHVLHEYDGSGGDVVYVYTPPSY